MKNKLRGVRISKGLSAGNVSKKLGISLSSFYNKESEKTDWTCNEVKKLLKIYNVRFEDIF